MQSDIQTIRTLCLISIFVLAFTLAGCATTPGCGLMSPNGRIAFSLDRSGFGFCEITATYTNISNKIVKPLINVYAFDSSDNTLGQTTIFFDEILPGKLQRMQHVLFSENICSVKKLFITNATTYAGGGYAYTICGVNETTYTFP
jgi:hypothetical protein